ncbi:MAG: TIR domain-containing protein [Burkholderiales bacterium]|nr:TIR domain-containing protein [Burkholderiales bacterium]
MAEPTRTKRNRRATAFLSYARADGQACARELHKRLGREVPDVEVWFDREGEQGGIGWWRQIAEQLGRADTLLLVMTPKALVSETARKEWRYARQQGAAVCPVFGVPSQELPLAEAPRWMAKAHIYDLAHEWDNFVRFLRNPPDAPRRPAMAPDVPSRTVPRTTPIGQLRATLIDRDLEAPLPGKVALCGPPGCGKTVLATMICHDEVVVSAFDDGILWTTLGERPDVQANLTQLCRALTGRQEAFVDEEGAATQLARLLDDRNCLVVIDDVWDPAHAQAFLRGGAGCTFLVTTRNLLAVDATRTVALDEMTDAEALTVFSDGTVDIAGDRHELERLCERLGNWPLLLGLAAAALRRRLTLNDTFDKAVAFLHEALGEHGVTAFDVRSTKARSLAFGRTIELSLGLLDPTQRARYTELAIFPADTDVDIDVIVALWQASRGRAEGLITEFAELSLLRFDAGSATLRLHDVVRHYLAAQLGDATRIHERLVRALGYFRAPRSEYEWRWAAYHLRAAGLAQHLHELLLDPSWLERKLQATDAGALLRDFDGIEAEGVRLVGEALKLSAGAIAQDPIQIRSQLRGRLLSLHSPQVVRLMDQLHDARDAVWLCPLTPALPAPGGAIRRILRGHNHWVTGLALTPQGALVSGAHDGQIRLWDLDKSTSTVIGTHDHWVEGVAVTTDGRILSSSADDRVCLWEIGNAQPRVLARGRYRSVAATLDGHLLASSFDSGIQVWDLGSWRQRTLKASGYQGHLTVLPDGRVASGSPDGTIRLWNLDRGRSRSMKVHEHGVDALAAAPDGRIISASGDATLRISDIDGRRSRVIARRAAGIRSLGKDVHGKETIAHWIDDLVLIPDGWIVTASEDGLQAWKIVDGEQRCIAREARAKSLARLNDGRLVTGGYDGTIRLWEFDARSGDSTPPAGPSSSHAGLALGVTDERVVVTDKEAGDPITDSWKPHDIDAFWGVAVSPDGWIVSDAGLNTVQAWHPVTGERRTVKNTTIDFEDDQAVVGDSYFATASGERGAIHVWFPRQGHGYTLQNHAAGISGLALAPSGCLLSASYDGSLFLWDRDFERYRDIEVHAEALLSLAISPDGRRIAVGDRDNIIHVMALDGSDHGRLRGHGDWPVALQFLSNRLLVSGSMDGTVRVWDVDRGEAIACFTADNGIGACVVASDGTIVVSDRKRIFLLELVLPRGLELAGGKAGRSPRGRKLAAPGRRSQRPCRRSGPTRIPISALPSSHPPGTRARIEQAQCSTRVAAHSEERTC